MRMRQNGGDLVKRYSSDCRAAFADGQKATISRQVPPILCDIKDLVHGLTRA